MRDQETINKQIRIAEQELVALNAKRTALQDRIKQLQGLKQSIADEQLPFNRQSESNVTNESTDEQKIALLGTLSQYAGRLHRIYDRKKEVVIYDYLDVNVPVLARMYDKRTKGYRSIGYEIEDEQS